LVKYSFRSRKKRLNDEKIAALLEKANAAFAKKDYALVLSYVTDSKLLMPPGDPRNGDFYALSGYALLANGNPVGAEMDLTHALKRAPENAALYLSRARAYLAMRQHENARRDFQEAVRLDSLLKQFASEFQPEQPNAKWEHRVREEMKKAQGHLRNKEYQKAVDCWLHAWQDLPRGELTKAPNEMMLRHCMILQLYYSSRRNDQMLDTMIRGATLYREALGLDVDEYRRQRDAVWKEMAPLFGIPN
jgi:tetratricopeptide (TPR) repeat protein